MPSGKDILFGTNSNADITTLPTKTAGQQDALAKLLASLGTGASSTPSYTGQINAPINSAQNTSLTALEDQAKGIATGSTNNEALKALSNLLSSVNTGGTGVNTSGGQSVVDLFNQNKTGNANVTDALTPLLSGNPANIDAYFKSAVQDPMLRSYAQDIAPVISRGFAANNNYSSSDRQLADQRAQQDLFNSLTTARAQTAYQAQQDAITNALSAAGVLSGNTNTANANLSGLIGTGLNQQNAGAQTLLGTAQQLLQQPGTDIANLLNVMQGGNNIQQINQQQLDNIKSQFNVQTDAEAQRIALLLQALGVNTSENIATVTPGQPGVVQNAASGLGNFLGQAVLGPVGSIF